MATGGGSPEFSILITSFQPSPEALSDLFRTHVDDSMLQEIAGADYGDRKEEHFAAVRQIRDDRRVPSHKEWVPCEVLELIRWSNPEDPDWKPGSTGKNGHWMRAFSCVALLRLAAEPENQDCFQGENQTVAPLVGSAVSLGRDVAEATFRFLAWRFTTLPRSEPFNEEDRPFFALALLILSVHLFRRGDDAQRIVDLIALVEDEESRIRKTQTEEEFTHKPEEWLLGLTGFTIRHSEWRRLAETILVAADPPLPPAALARVQAIGLRLLGISAGDKSQDKNTCQ